MTPRQQRALAALLTAPNKAAAAQMAGVSGRTLRTYLQNPTFASEFQRLQSEQIADAASRGRQSMVDAMNALRAVMDDETQNGQTRVSAARSLLEFGMRLDEREGVMRRLDALEQSMTKER